MVHKNKAKHFIIISIFQILFALPDLKLWNKIELYQDFGHGPWAWQNTSTSKNALLFYVLFQLVLISIMNR